MSADLPNPPPGRDGSLTDPDRLNVSEASAPVEVPVFNCIVRIRASDRGEIRARVANLANLECLASSEREALAKVVGRFKQRMMELTQAKAEIPWIDPPEAAADDEKTLFIAVHL